MLPKTSGMPIATGYCAVSLLLLGGLLLPLTSCGGGGGGGGPEYDYGVMLSPDKTTVAPGGTINLNVHYDAPKNNAGISWKLTCAQADCGLVSAAGIYTAPAKVDQQLVVGIRATSNDAPTMSYYVEVWVTGKIVVHIMPNNSPIGVAVGMTTQFTATVNSPDTAIVWQVNGAAGGNSTVGTVSATGLYTAPAQVPDPDTVTLTAIAHADSTATASVQITVWPVLQVSVSIDPQDRSVPTGATLQFTATVLNTDDTVVVWQVNGIEGGNSTLGTISAAGLFTAPATIPSPAKETITAVSHADPTKSASTSVTIVTLHNSLLNGSYTFEISGPDASGKMAAAIGSLVADGNGNLHGLIDMNSVASPAAQKAQAFTGAYSIGAQNLGLMVLNLTPQLILSFTVNDSGNDAKLAEFDTLGTRYVGSLQRQDANLSWNEFVGYYVLSCFGTTMSGERMTAIGRFQAVSGGAITNASVYVKEQGSSLATLANQTGAFSMSSNAYGRGDFGLTQSDSTVAHFSYYMTNGGDLYFLSTDPVPSDNPLLVGRILKQASGPFSYASLKGASVFSLAGVVASDASKSVLVAGQWQADPNSNYLTGSYDLNHGGQISTTQSLSATYSIDVTGHGYLGVSGFLSSLIFYIVDQNRAILMSGSEVGLIGMAEPQTATTFDNSLLSGTYRIGPISMPLAGGSLSQGILVTTGSGTFWAGETVLDQGATTQTFSGTYSVDATGRTLITVTNPEAFQYTAYPVSAARFVAISIEPDDSKANLTSLDQ